MVEHKNKLTQKDAIFFMDMVDSVWSPNFTPKLYKAKPYTKILKERSSNKYKRFIRVYKSVSNVLSERELIILNEFYGINKEKFSLKTVAELLSLSPERVRQIRNKAENRLARELLQRLKIDTK